MIVEPLPSAGISKILELVELLDDHGGRENLYKLTRDMHAPFAEMLVLVKSAEMLKLADTTGDDVIMSGLGKKILAAAVEEKKRLLREQMVQLGVFKHVVHMLENNDRRLPADVIVEQLAVLLPQEPPRQLFTTLLNWGRYGEVFGYDRESDQFFLQAR
jgi:NitT/TauT family transport system ATP-binding protein